MHIGVPEDDPSQLELIVLLVEEGQHTTRGFSLGADFKAGLKRETFDLGLVDWVLPDGGGGEVIQWVRSHIGWRLPVIVVTAQDDEPTVVAALEAGADDYIVKLWTAAVGGSWCRCMASATVLTGWIRSFDRVLSLQALGQFGDQGIEIAT